MAKKQFRRPFWCSYVTAYVAIGIGVTIFDASAHPGGDVILKFFGLLLTMGGIIVFVSALSYSLKFVLLRKLPVRRFCRSCGYNLRGNVTGVCPECGTRWGDEESNERTHKQTHEVAHGHAHA